MSPSQQRYLRSPQCCDGAVSVTTPCFPWQESCKSLTGSALPPPNPAQTPRGFLSWARTPWTVHMSQESRTGVLSTSISHLGPSSQDVCIPGMPRGKFSIAGEGTIQSLSGLLRLPEHFLPPAADAESNVNKCNLCTKGKV